jgi:hypothetical protein
MSHLTRLSAIYSLISGLAMIIIWVIFYAIGQVDDLIKSGPASFYLLMTAECLTSIILLTAGFGVMLKKPWASKLFLIAMGMMLYAVIYASGQFFQKGHPVFGGFFVLIALATINISLFNLAEKPQIVN